MALAHRVTTNASVTVATSTSVAPGAAIPDNCTNIVISNPSGGGTLLVSGAGIAVGTVLVAGTNAFPVAPGGALSLDIGTLAQRGDMTGSNGISYGASAATTAYILYTNNLGAT